MNEIEIDKYNNNSHSIIKLLITSLTIVIGIVSLIISIIFAFTFAQKGLSDLKKEAEKSSIHLAKILQQPLWEFDEKRIKTTGEAYSIDKRLLSLKISDIDNNVLYFSGDIYKNNGITRTKKIVYENRVLGSVEITFSQKDYKNNVRQIVLATILSNVLILITVFLLTGSLVRKYLRHPLDRLILVAKKYSEGNYSAPIEKKQFKEFTPLTDALVQMGCEIEKQLQEQKESAKERALLFTAIGQAGEGIIITDSEGIIQYCNPAFESMTQYSQSEVRGSNPRILKSGIHDNKFYKNIWETIKSGDRWSGHFTNKRKDNTLYEEDCSISPIKLPDGTITNFVAVKKDVTEEINLQNRINQSQKMEAIGTLAGGIAHDFNNILGGIIGFTEILENYVEGNKKAEQIISHILNASERASGLVKQILTFARQSEHEKVSVKFKSILIEALKLIRASLPSTIDINESICSDAMVLVDPTQLHQIIMNLCTNAKLAMPDGGILDINLEDIEIDEDFSVKYKNIPTGPYIKFTVSDTGIGIPKDIQSRIFDPFFTTRNAGEGTGMGLSVVHGIVDDAKGVISVYSEPRVGTSFKIFLPIVRRNGSEEENEKKHIPKGSERILFIDDEELLVYSGTLMLEQLGYTVTGCQNSLEALKLFKSNPLSFDLVISDTTMPDLTGDILATKVKKIRPDIPFILLSGFSERVNRETAKAIGASDFLMKPIIKKTLAEAVRKALD